MGIDAEIWVDAVGVTGQQFDAAAVALTERFGPPWPGRSGRLGWEYPWGDNGEGIIQFYTAQRYFSPHNRKGDWPRIRSYLDALAAAFPNSTIYYHGDSDRDAYTLVPMTVVTAERLAALDALWAERETR